jgi:hypothetical protein
MILLALYAGTTLVGYLGRSNRQPLAPTPLLVYQRGVHR